MAKDENNERTKEKEEKQCVEFATPASFSISTSPASHQGPWILCGLATTQLLKPKYRVDLKDLAPSL